MGCTWTEGVPFGGHSRDVEAVSEPLRSKWGASDPAARKGSHHTLLHPPTTGPERGAEQTKEKKARAGRRGDTCQGALGVRRRSAGWLGRQKIRLRGRRQGRPLSESATGLGQLGAG